MILVIEQITLFFARAKASHLCGVPEVGAVFVPLVPSSSDMKPPSFM